MLDLVENPLMVINNSKGIFFVNLLFNTEKDREVYEEHFKKEKYKKEKLYIQELGNTWVLFFSFLSSEKMSIFLKQYADLFIKFKILVDEKDKVFNLKINPYTPKNNLILEKVKVFLNTLVITTLIFSAFFIFLVGFNFFLWDNLTKFLYVNGIIIYSIVFSLSEKE